MHVLMYRWI